MSELASINAGDDFRGLPAGDWNTLMEMAREWRLTRRTRPYPSVTQFRQSGILPVKNDTGADQTWGAVLGIDPTPLITPLQSLGEFITRGVLVGKTPDADAHSSGRFGILIEPIPAGGTGRAVVGSVARVQVDLVDVGHVHADLTDGDCTKLTSAAAGPAVILTIDREETGVHWATICIGGGAGAAGVEVARFILRTPLLQGAGQSNRAIAEYWLYRECPAVPCAAPNSEINTHQPRFISPQRHFGYIYDPFRARVGGANAHGGYAILLPDTPDAMHLWCLADEPPEDWTPPTGVTFGAEGNAVWIRPKELLFLVCVNDLYSPLQNQDTDSCDLPE